MIRTIFLLAMWGAMAVGCGGQPNVALRASAPLPDGEAVYRLRYNPPPCLADQPELHIELETTVGWERVALEDGPDGDRVDALLERFERSPSSVVPALGNLTNRTRNWAGQHASRIFVLQAIDPPLPPDETPPAG